MSDRETDFAGAYLKEIMMRVAFCVDEMSGEGTVNDDVALTDEASDHRAGQMVGFRHSYCVPEESVVDLMMLWLVAACHLASVSPDSFPCLHRYLDHAFCCHEATRVSSP